MLDLKVRTREFSLAVIRLYVRLPRTTEAQIMGRQMLRSATSVGAQFRESQRAKSDADFTNKIEGALQEAEETLYWFELLVGASVVNSEEIENMTRDLNEIMAVFVSMVRKVKDKSEKR